MTQEAQTTEATPSHEDLPLCLDKPFATHAVLLVEATPESFAPYGRLETDFERAEVEIVPWPVSGWRPLDPGTGNEGGTVEGRFEFWWQGDVLHARNRAVNGQYVLGWARNPAEASKSRATVERAEILCHHVNYHPDGGQIFCPRERTPFVAPLALPGNDLKPEHFVAFYCDGSFGINIRPGVWHAAVFPFADRATFDGRQGAVHARISCHTMEEFGVYLSVPLRKP